MGWNEPDKGKEPWGDKQPPDLDELVKRMHAKLKSIFSADNKKKFEPNTSGGGAIFVGLIAVFLLFIWLLSGIFIVDPAEQAAILRFGKYIKTVGPGPHWIPRLIDSKIIVNVDRVSDYSYSAQMLTQDENLVSVSVAVQYRIGDLEAYLFNVANPEESLQQATSSALRQVVGKTTLDQIITAGREAWGINVQDSLVKILNTYKTGITIVNVSPQPARAPENVQDAFDDAIKAQEDEKRFKEQAIAYKARVVPIAQGNAKRITEEAKAFAQQVVLKAKGDVAEFLALLPQFLQAPELTSERMYLDNMQQVLANSNKVLVDAKAGNMLYLPLDKFQASTSIPATVVQAAKAQQNLMSTSEANFNYDGRPFSRQTSREGRESYATN